MLNNFKKAFLLVAGSAMAKLGNKISEEQELIATSARDFAEQYIRPHVMEWDEVQHFPKDVLHKASTAQSKWYEKTCSGSNNL